MFSTGNHPSQPDDTIQSLPEDIGTPNSTCDTQSISECTNPTFSSSLQQNCISFNSDSFPSNKSKVGYTLSIEDYKRKAVLFKQFISQDQPAKQTGPHHAYTKQSLAILHTDKTPRSLLPSSNPEDPTNLYISATQSKRPCTHTQRKSPKYLLSTQ